MKTRIATAAALIAISTVLFGACFKQNKQAKEGGRNAQAEASAVQSGFTRLVKSQPIPVFDFSQERQTLIDVETIRATGATSTTAFYLEGVGLIGWCPSIGAPVPSTYQLSNSVQYVDIPDDGERSKYPIDQGEPTGVYVGESSGTWTICVDDNGRKFGKYWEGCVDSTVAIVTTYPPEQRIMPSDVTYQFTTAD